ncbi:hypothetical protein AALA98_14625 [Lachnospiraceae bacterium 45-W7]
MRIIRCPVTLVGGYVFINDPDATSIENSEGNLNGPGIRMSVTAHSSLAEVADTFEFVTDKGNPDFEENFRQILRGENPRWKIVRVVIDYHSVNLQFASEHYYKEHNKMFNEMADADKMTTEEENRFLDSLPEYIDYATLPTKALRAELQFEIPPCGDATGETIDVSLSPTSHYGATVTEYDGNKKRVFELDSSGEYPDCSAYVTEYM